MVLSHKFPTVDFGGMYWPDFVAWGIKMAEALSPPEPRHKTGDPELDEARAKVEQAAARKPKLSPRLGYARW